MSWLGMLEVVHLLYVLVENAGNGTFTLCLVWECWQWYIYFMSWLRMPEVVHLLYVLVGNAGSGKVTVYLCWDCWKW